MHYKGVLDKMRTETSSENGLHKPQYYLDFIPASSINTFVGNELSINFSNKITCLHCGKTTKKSFGQGYCYSCFVSTPENEDCVLRPELCRAHEGIARDMEYATKHCLSDHIVYLAISSAIKVGVTRISQVPTRWVDQGASRAIKLAQTPNRYLAGCIEVALKVHMSDKTNWRHMLTNQVDYTTDLLEERSRVRKLVPESLQQFLSTDNNIWSFEYPVIQYPVKLNSLNLDKTPVFKGKLMGIKGQYLIFEGGTVFNVRSYSGYNVDIET